MEPGAAPIELSTTEAVVALVAVLLAILVVAPQLYAMLTAGKDKED